MPATWPAHGIDLTEAFLALDQPLAEALRILRDGEAYHALVTQAAQARATMPATAPATSRADDE